MDAPPHVPAASPTEPRRLQTEPIPACPACAGPGQIALSDCVDYMCGLPGRWSFRECDQCHSLWLDPRPTDASIPDCYPANYTCTRLDFPVDMAATTSIVASAKLSLLAKKFGYASLRSRARSPLGNFFGRLLTVVPAAVSKAGHSVRFLHSRPEGRLLDIGCGNGAFLSLMQKLGWEVEGIEPDLLAAEVARSRGIQVHVANAENAPIAINSFDAITLTHVAEHFASPGVILERLSSWLRPGGALVSVSPNPRGVIRRLFGNKWYQLDPPRHLFLPSRDGYRALLEPLGFEIEIWTSMRMAPWALNESMSIARKGAVHGGRPSPALKLFALLLSVFSLAVPNLGEEIISYARKR